MSYSIEFIYLFLALIFLLIVSFNLTAHMLTIYVSENEINKFFFSQKTPFDKNNFDINVISYLLIKKSQWIEAIQILKLTFLERQMLKYVESNEETKLLKNLYMIYNQLQEPSIARYYNKLVLLKNTINSKV